MQSQQQLLPNRNSNFSFKPGQSSKMIRSTKKSSVFDEIVNKIVVDLPIATNSSTATTQCSKVRRVKQVDQSDFNYDKQRDPGKPACNMFAEKLRKLIPKLPESRPASSSVVRLVHGPNVYSQTNGPIC
jgi:hypothetical protein